jgi:hypothetical protein
MSRGRVSGVGLIGGAGRATSRARTPWVVESVGQASSAELHEQRAERELHGQR